MAKQATTGLLNSGTRAIVLGVVAVIGVSVFVLALNQAGNTQVGQPGLPLRPLASPVSPPASGDLVGAPLGSAGPSDPPSGSDSPSPLDSPLPSASSAAAESTSRPPTTPVRVTPPKPAPAPPAAVFTAHHELRMSWFGGHISRITIRNTSNATGDWTVVITVDSGIREERYWIQNGGSANLAQSGTTIRATGRLAGGTSIIVEYQVARPPGASTEPRACSVNGSPCR